MLSALLSFQERPLYEAADARELLMLVGRADYVDADELAHVLSEIGKSFAFNLHREMQASTPQREKEAKRLADACQKVLMIVGVADGGELLPMFGHGGLFAAAHSRGEPRGEAATMNALHAVEMLRQDALKMLEVEGRRRRMKKPKPGRPENAALQELVRDLSCLYERAWRRAPGMSNGNDEPCGPLLRLMVHVVERLRGRGLRFGWSPSSLRQHWRRIDASEKMPETKILRDAGLLNADGSLP